MSERNEGIIVFVFQQKIQFKESIDFVIKTLIQLKNCKQIWNQRQSEDKHNVKQ